MSERAIWRAREDPGVPGRFVLRRHLVEVGEIRIDPRSIASPVAMAAIRMMVEDAVRVWNSTALGDALWITSEDN